MDEKNRYIEQCTATSHLYTYLHRKMLDELQRLSAEEWTNYNIHDPGVTTGDIANFVLTEVDYKLGFALVDYLTSVQMQFIPEKYGLYLPEQVYFTTPVTLHDYRILFLSHIPDLDNVIVQFDREKSCYTVRFLLSPFAEITEEKVKVAIMELFHANRNLCEKLGDVKSSQDPGLYWLADQSSRLYFHSEFEILSGESAETVLARIYSEILSYLNGNIYFDSYDELTDDERVWEDLLEGPEHHKRLMIPQQENTMEELYGLLSRTEGLKTFKTCFLATDLEGAGSIVSDFDKGYFLAIPEKSAELKVKIKMDGIEITKINVERFKKELEVLCLLDRPSVSRLADNEKIEISRKYIPKGKYRDVFAHRRMVEDFPACYRAGIDRCATFASTTNPVKNTPFGAYLSLFDLIIRRGLKELAEVKKLLSIDPADAVLEKTDTLPSPDIIRLEEQDRFRDIFPVKSQYLDWLDHLYGVESNPDWMAEFYEETPEEILKRRMNFLSRVPYLIQVRSKAYNLHAESSEENIPAIKAYISYLLGMNTNENIPVGDSSSGYSYKLVEREVKDDSLWAELKITPFAKDMLLPSGWETVEPDSSLIAKKDKRQDYDELFRELAGLRSGLVYATLFREGIHMTGYYILPAGDTGEEYSLVFLSREDEIRQDLAKSDRKDILRRWANLLRCFLIEQNRQSEGLYVLENSLLGSSEQTVTFVFSDWGARFSSPRFREICKQLIRKLLPAHLKSSVYWLKQNEMDKFEKTYRKWKTAWLNGLSPDSIKAIETEIKQLLQVS